MLKVIIIFLFSSILLPSNMMSNNYSLSLVFKSINVRSGDPIYLESNTKSVGSVTSNKVSNNYNIVTISIDNDVKIPINSIFKHSLIGSLRKNAIVMSPSKETIKYKNNDVVIVDFKGVTTICDKVVDMEKKYTNLSKDYDALKINEIEIKDRINKKNLDLENLEKNIKKLNQDFARIDTIVSNEKMNKLATLEKLDKDLFKKNNELSMINKSIKNNSLLSDSINQRIKQQNLSLDVASLEIDKINDEISKEKLNLNTIKSKYSKIEDDLTKAEKKYNEIISFVKENVIVLKDYDEQPVPANGKLTQDIIHDSLPEKLKGIYSGYVVVDVFISENGIVESINDIKSSPWSDEFSEDIEDHLYDVISSIKWNPATKNEKKIGISHKIAISFSY